MANINFIGNVVEDATFIQKDDFTGVAFKVIENTKVRGKDHKNVYSCLKRNGTEKFAEILRKGSLVNIQGEFNSVVNGNYVNNDVDVDRLKKILSPKENTDENS